MEYDMDNKSHISKTEQNVDENAKQSSSRGKIKSPKSTTSLPSMNFCPGDFKQKSWKFERVGGYFKPAENLSKLSAPRQEELLIRDFIYAFSGVPSTYIIPDIKVRKLRHLTFKRMSEVRFKIHDGFSSVFRTLANELLPLIGHYINIQSFIDETNMTRNCGRIRKALAESISHILEHYHDLQADLETKLNEKKLDLQKLVQYIRPWLPTMQIFSGIVIDIRCVKMNTAQQLTKLKAFCEVLKPTPDSIFRECLGQLLEEVSSGYMKSVELWMQKGCVFDPQEEFFIEDTDPSNAMSSNLLGPEQCCSSYWNQRYRLHIERLPDFLMQDSDMIFLAGKYLNILQQCNVTITLINTPLKYSPYDDGYVETIRASYELSAKKLMDFLFTEHDLFRQVHCLRSFGLLQQNTFANDLMEKSQEYLKRSVHDLHLNEMKLVFDDVLECLDEPFEEILHIEIKNCDVVTQLVQMKCLNDDAPLSEEMHPYSEETSSDPPEQPNLYGYEAVALRYEPGWPISLVITSHVSDQVQMLQRILFFLRYVQWQLVIFKANSTKSFDTIPIRRSSDTMVDQMLKTMFNIEQYMAIDVIEHLWVDLLRAVNLAIHIDDVLSAVKLCLDQCIAYCLFSEVTYVRAIFTLGSVCLSYCDCLPNDDESIEFDRSVTECEENFEGVFLCLVNLLREFAKPISKCGKTDQKLPDFSKKLLQRLESVEKGFHPNSLVPVKTDLAPL